MTDILQKAAARRAALQRERAEIQEQFAKLSERNQNVEQELEKLEYIFRLAGAEAEASHEVPASPSSGQGSKKAQILEHAARLIREHGPMTARAILDALDAEGRGDLVGGRDDEVRLKNISSTISREKGLFTSDRAAGGYRLAEGKGEAPADVAHQEGLRLLQ